MEGCAKKKKKGSKGDLFFVFFFFTLLFIEVLLVYNLILVSRRTCFFHALVSAPLLVGGIKLTEDKEFILFIFVLCLTKY